jgi:hypothetical protein
MATAATTDAITIKTVNVTVLVLELFEEVEGALLGLSLAVTSWVRVIAPGAVAPGPVVVGGDVTWICSADVVAAALVVEDAEEVEDALDEVLDSRPREPRRSLKISVLEA